MKKTNTRLDRIIEYKLKELEIRKKELPLSKIKSLIGENKFTKNSFKDSLSNKGRISLIAEIKKASPSLGIIKEDFNHIEIAKNYEKYGASAISVLTDEYFFQGNINFIEDIKKNVDLPILRKDFLFDPYQIYESKAFGADAILLIAGILSKEELRHFLDLAHELEMDCLLETHTYLEIDAANDSSADIIGINNRDLKTFAVDINNFLNLSRFIPKNKIIVCESGIFTRTDTLKVKLAGADAILVGESLMTAKDLKSKIFELMI